MINTGQCLVWCESSCLPLLRLSLNSLGKIKSTILAKASVQLLLKNHWSARFSSENLPIFSPQFLPQREFLYSGIVFPEGDHIRMG